MARVCFVVGKSYSQITLRSGATNKLGYSQNHIAVACGFAGVTGVGCGPTRYRDVVLTYPSWLKEMLPRKQEVVGLLRRVLLKECYLDSLLHRFRSSGRTDSLARANAKEGWEAHQFLITLRIRLLEFIRGSWFKNFFQVKSCLDNWIQYLAE